MPTQDQVNIDPAKKDGAPGNGSQPKKDQALWHISMRTLLIIVALIVLLCLGYAISTTLNLFSDNARLKRKLDAAEAAAKKTELQRVTAAQESAKAIARNHQEELLQRARNTTNSLGSLLVGIHDLKSNAEELRTSEQGKAVSIHPDLVLTACRLYQTQIPQLPSRDDLIQKLETARRIERDLLDAAGTTYEPDTQLTVNLQDAAFWADTMSRQLDQAKATLAAIVRESQIKMPPQNAPTNPQTLEAAMKELTLRETAEHEKLVTQKTVQLTSQAKSERADAVAATAAQSIRTDTEILKEQFKIREQKLQDEIDRLKMEAEMARQANQADQAKKQFEAMQKVNAVASQVQKDQMRAKAASAATKSLLAPFISTGYMRVSTRPSRAPAADQAGPVSLRDLEEAGALAPGIEGLKKLVAIASNPADKVRPRWSSAYRNPRAWEQDQTLRGQAEWAQKLLIELGPTMVEMGMLQP